MIRRSVQKNNYFFSNGISTVRAPRHNTLVAHIVALATIVASTTANMPLGTFTTTPKNPTLAIDVPAASENNAIYTHHSAATQPLTILTIRINGLRRMRNKNGNANNSAITIHPASTFANGSPPPKPPLSIHGAVSSNVNNCATSIIIVKHANPTPT